MPSRTGINYRLDPSFRSQSRFQSKSGSTSEQYVKQRRTETVFKTSYRYEKEEVQTSRTSSVVSVSSPLKKKESRTPTKEGKSLVPVKGSTQSRNTPLISIYNTKPLDSSYGTFLKGSFDDKDPPQVPQRDQNVPPPIPKREIQDPLIVPKQKENEREQAILSFLSRFAKETKIIDDEVTLADEIKIEKSVTIIDVNSTKLNMYLINNSFYFAGELKAS